MLTLPVSLFAALVLIALLIRGLVQETLPKMIAAVLVVCAGQAIVITLAQHYQLAGMIRVQPITAAFIPAISYLAFLNTAVRRVSLVGDWPHLLGPAFVAFCVFLVRDAVDFALLALFAGYGIAMFLKMRSGTDTLLRARLGAGDFSLLVWRVIAGFLIVSAVVDVMIALAISAGFDSWRGTIVSLAYSIQLLAIGGLSLSRAEPEDETDEQEPSTEPTEDEVALVARVQARMDQEHWYQEPDLTLNKLSRRLIVPAKTLSAAVNKVTGQNVSRFVNEYRINHACTALSRGEDAITTIMFDCGFETKSNFNREFRRVTGHSPSDWVRNQSTG